MRPPGQSASTADGSYLPAGPLADGVCEPRGLAIEENAGLSRKFTALYLESRVALRAYLHVFLRDEAAIDDCLQETAVVVWQRVQPDWTAEDFRRVAFTCARFKALGWLKKNKPSTLMFSEPEIVAKLAERVMVEAGSNADRTEQRITALRHCIDRLAPEQREIIHARYDPMADRSLADLADRKSRGMASLYKQLERLRTLLRECVERRTHHDSP